jgi:galactan 5-O-arabinofuranosyltransferase
MKRLTDTLKSPSTAICIFMLVIAVAGYFLYRYPLMYEYRSVDHIRQILALKIWAMVWVAGSIGVIFWLRRQSASPPATVGAVSAYFAIFFGIQFYGTQFGWNAYWGDNSVCIAGVEKAMYHGLISRDWYIHGLPAFYPPGWFWLMAAYGKLLQIEAYQTVKFGYLLVSLGYPWVLYLLWRNLVSRVSAAAVVVATIYFASFLLDISPYEHLTAGLFLPWWLYYFEGAESEHGRQESSRRRVIIGALIGGCLFMTYYYWFFIAFAALPFALIKKYLAEGSRSLWSDLRRRLTLMAGVALVGSPYWLPLLVSLVKNGSESTQGVWFRIEHTNWADTFSLVSVESIVILGGIASAIVLWDRWRNSKLALFFAGMFLLVIADRLANLSGFSIQSRKVFDLLHVFCAAPLAIIVLEYWQSGAGKSRRRALIGIGLILALIAGNRQTEAYTSDYYRTAINSRKPTGQLAPFLQVDHEDRVFLTDQYEVACFLPICLFVPTGNAGMHPAGKYSERVKFLSTIAAIQDPDIFAYALAYNRFDSVSYIFLPTDTTSGTMSLSLYQLQFNGPTKEIGITFQTDIAAHPDLFVAKHPRGPYQITPPLRSADFDSRIARQVPGLVPFLKKL